MKLKLLSIKMQVLLCLLATVCVSVCDGASGLPLPSLLSGSGFNTQGQVTGRAVRADIRNNEALVDQQSSVLKKTRNGIKSLDSKVSSALTGMNNQLDKIEVEAKRQAGANEQGQGVQR